MKNGKVESSENKCLTDAAIKLAKTHKINILGYMKSVYKICMYAKSLIKGKAIKFR